MNRQYEKNKNIEQRLAAVARKQQELKRRIDRIQIKSREFIG